MSTPSRPSSSSAPPRRFFVLRHGQTNHNALGILQGSSDASRLTNLGTEQAQAIGSAALGIGIGSAHGSGSGSGSSGSQSGSGSKVSIKSVYVSPLTRAQHTLELLRSSVPRGPDAPLVLPPPSEDVILPNLREIDLYSWQDRTKDYLRARHPQEYAAWKKGDPNGVVVDGRKPLLELWERAGKVWEEVRSAELLRDEELGEESRVLYSSHDDDGEEDAAAAAATQSATLLMCHGTLGQALLGSAFGLDATIFRRNKFPNCGMAEILWHDDDDMATAWRWRYPTPGSELGCLREQLGSYYFSKRKLHVSIGSEM